MTLAEIQARLEAAGNADIAAHSAKKMREREEDGLLDDTGLINPLDNE